MAEFLGGMGVISQEPVLVEVVRGVKDYQVVL